MQQTLDFRQAQTVVMTPQMQQAVKLLQMNNQELAVYLEEEVAQNPLLDKAETPASDDPPVPDPKPDMDFSEVNNFAGVGAGGAHSFDTDDRTLEETLAEHRSLRAYLQEQLATELPDMADRLIGSLLIDRLDEQGYLREDVATLAATLHLPLPRVTSVLARLRRFDPPGIFASDLADCLRLQLIDRGQYDDLFAIILENLPLVANRDYPALQKVTQQARAVLEERIAILKHLNPKPISDFEHFVVQTAIPDVLMKPLPREVGGGWRVELNTATLPKVLFNQVYATEILDKSKTPQDKSYMQTQIQSASWLVRALDQRAQTILKVAGAIVAAQDGFFLYGIEFLKPLTLRDIAAEIDMHESTVSRVTTGKYIGTPRGLFELKFFFSGGIAGADGAPQLAAEAVKARVKTLIDTEKPEAVLSDDAIVDLLRAEGIEIARRTVAKYRDMLGIPASSVRRRQKG